MGDLNFKFCLHFSTNVSTYISEVFYTDLVCYTFRYLQFCFTVSLKISRETNVGVAV